MQVRMTLHLSFSVMQRLTLSVVINAWARSREKIAPVRAEQILNWMQNLRDLDVQPDKVCQESATLSVVDSLLMLVLFRVVHLQHSYPLFCEGWRTGGGRQGTGASNPDARALPRRQHTRQAWYAAMQHGPIIRRQLLTLCVADTITYNVVINSLAKSGGKGAASEAEKLLSRMHALYEMGDPDVKPNIGTSVLWFSRSWMLRRFPSPCVCSVTYGSVIDSFAKSGEPGAASRADSLLANMIQLHQSDPVRHADLLPNTFVFNTVIKYVERPSVPNMYKCLILFVLQLLGEE